MATVPPSQAAPSRFRRVLAWIDRELRVHREGPFPLGWDILFGILAPAVVLTLDLEMEHLGMSVEMLPLRPYTSVLAWVAMGALALWLPFRGRSGWGQAPAAGVFLVAAGFAGAVGVVLLPLALLFSIAGIGLLGLVPLLTAFVFARAARRAWLGARPSLARGPALGMVLLAAAVFGGGCLAAGRLVRIAEWRCSEVLAGLRPGDPARAERVLAVLRRIPGVWLRDLRREALDDSLPAAARKRAREAYERITGRDAEEHPD